MIDKTQKLVSNTVTLCVRRYACVYVCVRVCVCVYIQSPCSPFYPWLNQSPSRMPSAVSMIRSPILQAKQHDNPTQ